MSFSGWALSLLWPERCILCDRVVGYGQITCGLCDRQTPPLTQAACCEERPVAAVWRYQKPVPDAISRFKFQGDRDTGRKLALLMARAWRRQCPNFGAELITFVPMPPERQRSRGFNQAELLARWVGEDLALPVVPLLRREGVLMQHQLSAGFRRKRRDAFDLLPGSAWQAKGRRVLLVDDITTTGGTTLACARLLLQAGAEDAAVLVAASGL